MNIINSEFQRIEKDPDAEIYVDSIANWKVAGPDEIY